MCIGKHASAKVIIYYVLFTMALVYQRRHVLGGVRNEISDLKSEELLLGLGFVRSKEMK